MRKLLFYPVMLMGMLCIIQSAQSQDPNFTQYFSTPTYYNPAYTGISTGIRARFVYRDQWPNLPNDFRSYYFSADIGDRNLPGSGGLGLIINSDNEGVGFIKNLSVGLGLAVRIPISENIISQVGIKASILQKRLNWDDFVWSDQLSEKYGNIHVTSFIPPDNNSRIIPDFGVGGVLQFSNPEGNITGSAGFAVDHLFRPDEAFLTTSSAPLPRKYVANLDMVISTGGYGWSGRYSSGSGEDLKISPGIIYQNQANLSSFQAGLNLYKYNIYVGGWYKTALSSNSSSAVALLAGYKYTFAPDMSIKFMYSYDMQIAGNLQGLGGAHEISLILEFSKLSLFGGGGYNYMPGRGSRGSAFECPSLY